MDKEPQPFVVHQEYARAIKTKEWLQDKWACMSKLSNQDMHELQELTKRINATNVEELK
jgi:hypothetical protein